MIDINTLYEIRDDCEDRHLIQDTKHGWDWDYCEGCIFYQDDIMDNERIQGCGAMNAFESDYPPMGWEPELLEMAYAYDK